MTDTPVSGSVIPILLKWGKKTFEISIVVGESSTTLKQRVQEQTGVPASRQKLLTKKGGWKGSLKNDIILDGSILATKKNNTVPLAVTLIGSAEILAAPPATKIKFIEDLTPEDLKKAEEAELQAAMKTATGMISALQLSPHRRDDGKQEELLYQYNRLVTGLPQQQIERELKYRDSENNNGTNSLQGKVAMNLGLELRRAYVNDLAVLDDGTCISAMDDGHVQLWKHGAQQEDVIHPGMEGGIDSVVALHEGNFATAGRGSIQLWNSDAEPIITLPGAMRGTTPTSLTAIIFKGRVGDTDGNNTITCLAARFRITRQHDPQQFRLPPQNDTERERRAQSEAHEQAIQQALSKASRSIQLWFSVGRMNSTSLRSQILEPPFPEGGAPITCLTCMAMNDGTQVLVAGDVAGGLRLWKVQLNKDNRLWFEHQGLYQLKNPSPVVCLQILQNNRLAVSTGMKPNIPIPSLPGAMPIPNEIAQAAVHILDFSSLGTIAPRIQASLMGHNKDAVICMCELPNGDLMTGGGKLDATLQLWSKCQFEIGKSVCNEGGEGKTEVDGISAPPQANVVLKAEKTLTEVGYVFSIQVLPDRKLGSNYFAVAVARYNTVKIMI